MYKKKIQLIGIKFFLAISLATMILTGCGQKGPLYLPETEQRLTK